jgi:hypothetical protein
VEIIFAVMLAVWVVSTYPDTPGSIGHHIRGLRGLTSRARPAG